jgi:hypothetical protein
MEAQYWERRHGRDAYSAFLLKHGERPSPTQAEVIGKVVGRRVKASDGLRYPKLHRVVRSADDREKWKIIKRRLRAAAESPEADMGQEGSPTAS